MLSCPPGKEEDADMPEAGEAEMVPVEDALQPSDSPLDDPDEVALQDVDSDGEPEDSQQRALMEEPLPSGWLYSDRCPSEPSLSQDPPSQNSPRPTTPHRGLALEEDGAADELQTTPGENKTEIVLIEDTPDKGVVDDSEATIREKLRALKGELSTVRQRKTAGRLVSQ